MLMMTAMIIMIVYDRYDSYNIYIYIYDMTHTHIYIYTNSQNVIITTDANTRWTTFYMQTVPKQLV